jgi:hypothetical protein
MLYYMLPGTTSEEIDNNIINDPNVKKGKEHYYISPRTPHSTINK